MNTEELYSIFKVCAQISTDTRKISQDCLFWGLKGQSFDGGNFCEQALQAGAKYAIRQSELPSESENIIHVTDSLLALQDLARFHRRKFGIPILAITGSNGKTTTKELISNVLSAHYKTHSTTGNFNNHIGVPLTLLAMPEDTEIAVIEMGANHQGEIMELSKITEPTCGLITNIGLAHLEGFGGVEGVKKGKSELYKYLADNDGLIFVNMDEPELAEISEGFNKKILYKRGFEQSREFFSSHVEIESSEGFLNVSFNSTVYGRITVASHLVGEYNFNNIMTAIVIGQYFKVPDLLIKQAIENYFPSNNRSQYIKMEGYNVILDAYNANPSSMAQAILNIKSQGANRKIIILGDMFELGEFSFDEHQRIAKLALDTNPNQLVLVGEEFEKIKVPEIVLKFVDAEKLKIWYTNLDKSNSSILIKGSRGMKLESILD